MLGNAFSGWHLLIILAVILLLFGAAKLPALAKSVGQSARVFRSEIKEMKKEDSADAASANRIEDGEARQATNLPAEPGSRADDSKS